MERGPEILPNKPERLNDRPESTLSSEFRYPQPLTLFVEFPLEQYGQDGLQRRQEINRMLHSPMTPDRDDTLAEFLRAKHISLSVTFPADGDGETLRVMKDLEREHIPFAAWAAIRDVDGYYLNDNSARAYIDRVDMILRYAESQDVDLKAIGLDIEFPLQDQVALATGKLPEFMLRMMRHRLDYLRMKKHGKDPRPRLQDAVNRYMESGVFVETYQTLPSLMKLFGLPVIQTSDNVEMLYTSVVSPVLRKLIFRTLWDPRHTPAFGIVNGVNGRTPGRDFGNGLPRHLTYNKLADDIVMARQVRERKLAMPLSRICVFALNAPEVAARVQWVAKDAGVVG